jgi:hypothetical protein
VIDAEGAAIKFEVVLEARIALEPASAVDQIAGVATLSALDMATSKLLANSDRWGDDSVFSRDLIDLAMMQPSGALLEAAIAKARVAYGDSIQRDLARATAQLQSREGRLGQCMRSLQMTQPRALVWQRIRAMTKRAALASVS